MLRYSVNRILWSIPVVLLTLLLTFTLVKQLPSSPFERNPRIFTNKTILNNLNEKYGLDKPWYVQYGNYVSNVARGDFGPSMKEVDRDVTSIISQRLPTSALLGFMGFVMSAILGVLFGMVSAVWSNKWPDYASTIVATMGFAFPVFSVGTVGYYHLNRYGIAGWDTWPERIGPVTVLAFSIMPYFHRLVRAAMLETLESDFVMAARSKGISLWRVRIRHVLRNSLIPVVNNAGPLFGFIITGSFIIELVFAIPGLGPDFIASAVHNDTNVLLGTTVVLTLAIVVMNLIVDLIMPVLDPRITHGG